MSISLIPICNWVNGKVLFENLSEPINKQIVYQSVTLFVTIIFLLLLLVIKKDKFKEFFRKGNISAEILPERMVAINPKPNENWFNFGRNFAIIISVVTAVIIYFQVISQTEISFVRMLSVLPFSILFALSNSFVEESITRLGVVVVLKDIINDKIIPIVSALLFGSIHFWGHPGGIVGVLFSGFLGWLLAKSIIETKGIFWAWLIHFLLDVIIFTALLTIT